MSQQTLGFKYISAVVEDGDLAAFTNRGDLSALFRAVELPTYEFITDFAKAHGKIPDADTIETHTSIELPEVTEPASYFLGEIEKRYIEKGIRDAVKESSVHLKPGKGKDPVAALEIVTSAIARLHLMKTSNKVIDYRESLSAILSQYTAAAMSAGPIGVCLGYPHLDDLTGGLSGGDLVSIVGRPAVGKTWFVVSMANHVWEHQHMTPLVVSMEVALGPLQLRQAALHAHIPSMGLKLGELTSKALVKLETKLAAAADHDVPYWIADGSMSASVQDVAMLAQQLKPDVVFVDGAYLMKCEGFFRTKYQRVGAVAEGLKMMANDLNIPVIASWQFNRDAGKKKKGEQITLDDIAYADEIGQISSIILGLFQDETPETLMYRVIDILKGRTGEQGRFKTNWNFDTMDFSQLHTTGSGELLYV